VELTDQGAYAPRSPSRYRMSPFTQTLINTIVAARIGRKGDIGTAEVGRTCPEGPPFKKIGKISFCIFMFIPLCFAPEVVIVQRDFGSSGGFGSHYCTDNLAPVVVFLSRWRTGLCNVSHVSRASWLRPCCCSRWGCWPHQPRRQRVSWCPMSWRPKLSRCLSSRSLPRLHVRHRRLLRQRAESVLCRRSRATSTMIP